MALPTGYDDTAELIPIGAAVEALRKHYADVSHSSLRFLEREGLVTATRTSGGHRLYSPADLERVLLIKRWQEEGNSLEAVRSRLAVLDALPSPELLSKSFLEAAEDHRVDEARRIIENADRMGMSSEVIFFRVLEPALIAVGHQWQAGTLPVFEEKTISELCRELIAAIALRHAPAVPTGPMVLAACVEGERHELGLHMMIGLLRQRGYRVRYLGADVATNFLADAVASHRPNAVLLSSSTLHSFDGCMAAISAIRQLRNDNFEPAIVVGGSILHQFNDALTDAGVMLVADHHDLDNLEYRLLAFGQNEIRGSGNGFFGSGEPGK